MKTAYDKIVTFIIIAIISIYFSKTCSENNKLKNNGIVTRGYVYGIFRYVFIVNNKSFKGGISEHSKSDEAIGDSIDIIYLPDKPNINLPLCDINNSVASTPFSR